jgi:hypothetical protein
MSVNCNFVGYKHPIFDELIGYNRDIRKVRKRQHQYPELTAPTCTATIIPLEPCALNAEIQHFKPSFSISY